MKTKRFAPGLLLSVLSLVSLVLCPSCNTEAEWETEDVELNMVIETVSAGYVECHCESTAEAYFLLAIEPVDAKYNPLEHQKQFMTLALDSANVAYIQWRNKLLKEGEFTVAPFASHALQYTSSEHFFTGLIPNTEYWVYAFVVNPETLEPAGKLYIEKVKTTEESIMDIHFDYRVRGRWDYIYPVDTNRKIYNHFPYIATTRDSLTMVTDGLYTDAAAVLYFVFWTIERFMDPSLANILYGVKAVENNGIESAEKFQEGHTYYTVIGGYDGSFKQTTIYKFRWTGESCNLYYHDTDSANLAVLFANETL